jgi:molybdopterin converting factor small subunit
MKVYIKLIATYQKLLPAGTQGNQVEINIPPRATVAQILAQYQVPLDDTSVIVLNGLTVGLNTLVSEGDTVSAFSAIAGG